SVDRRARLMLAGALALAALAGPALVLTMPLGLPFAGGLALVWTGGCGLEALRFRRAAACIDRILISADGAARGRRNGAPGQSLGLLPGSVVGERWGGVRLRFEDGRSYGELVRRDGANPEAWRRLQVIWRHRGNFGAAPRS